MLKLPEKSQEREKKKKKKEGGWEAVRSAWIKSEALLVLYLIFINSQGNLKVHPRMEITDKIHPSHWVAQSNPVFERTGIKTVPLISNF